jgi:hypothetical protein
MGMWLVLTLIPIPPHVSLSDFPYQSLLCIFAHATCSATIQKERNKKRMQEKGRKHEKKKKGNKACAQL